MSTTPGNRPALGRSRQRATAWLLALLAIVGVGAGLRGAVAWATLPVQPAGDELYYIWLAVNIAEGKGHEFRKKRAAWPPAHPYVLSRFVKPELLTDPRMRGGFPTDFLRPLVGLQTALGALVVLLTALLGRELFDRRVGIVAGAIAALYPTFVAFSHYQFSENQFAVLLTAGLLGIVHLRLRPSRSLSAATGLIFGLAALTREEALVVALAGSIWWTLANPRAERRRALARSALVLGVAVLVILPWTLRNYLQFQRIVPVSMIGWMALREGNTLPEDDWMHKDQDTLDRFRNRYFRLSDDAERLDLARREALTLIAGEQPTWIFKKLIRNTSFLFRPDSYVFTKLGWGSYGYVTTSTVRWVLVAVMGSYLLVACAAVLGIAASPGRWRVALPCLALGGVVLVHVIANANARYRFPLMPLVIVYAAYCSAHWHCAKRRLRGLRLAAAAATVAFFFGVCLPHFAPHAGSYWRQGVTPDRVWRD